MCSLDVLIFPAARALSYFAHPKCQVNPQRPSPGGECGGFAPQCFLLKIIWRVRRHIISPLNTCEGVIKLTYYQYNIILKVAVTLIID